jgi:hypothetical protein
MLNAWRSNPRIPSAGHDVPAWRLPLIACRSSCVSAAGGQPPADGSLGTTTDHSTQSAPTHGWWTNECPGQLGKRKTNPVDALATARITAQELQLPPVRLTVGVPRTCGRCWTTERD